MIDNVRFILSTVDQLLDYCTDLEDNSYLNFLRSVQDVDIAALKPHHENIIAGTVNFIMLLLKRNAQPGKDQLELLISYLKACDCAFKTERVTSLATNLPSMDKCNTVLFTLKNKTVNKSCLELSPLTDHHIEQQRLMKHFQFGPNGITEDKFWDLRKSHIDLSNAYLKLYKQLEYQNKELQQKDQEIQFLKHEMENWKGETVKLNQEINWMEETLEEKNVAIRQLRAEKTPKKIKKNGVVLLGFKQLFHNSL